MGLTNNNCIVTLLFKKLLHWVIYRQFADHPLIALEMHECWLPPSFNACSSFA
jgi:hypothetical protein